MDQEQPKQLSQLADLVIKTFEREEPPSHERKIQVNPVVSKFATWYEKLRNVMEYREDEVILRAAIERILSDYCFLEEMLRLLLNHLFEN